MDFANRLRLELGVSLRFGQELSILDFRSSDVDIDAGQMVARYLGNISATALRGTDGIFVLGRDRCIVLLSGTDCLNASRVWQRLVGLLEDAIPESRFRNIETDFLALDGAETQLLVDYFLGELEQDRTELLSESELKELEFSDEEFQRFEQGAFFDGEDLEIESSGFDAGPEDDADFDPASAFPMDEEAFDEPAPSVPAPDPAGEQPAVSPEPVQPSMAEPSNVAPPPEPAHSAPPRQPEAPVAPPIAETELADLARQVSSEMDPDEQARMIARLKVGVLELARICMGLDRKP